MAHTGDHVEPSGSLMRLTSHGAGSEVPTIKRFRLRLSTLLFVVAILALLLVVVIQQMQIGRMRQSIDVAVKEKEKLITVIRELQDHVFRHQRPGQ